MREHLLRNQKVAQTSLNVWIHALLERLLEDDPILCLLQIVDVDAGFVHAESGGER